MRGVHWWAAAALCCRCSATTPATAQLARVHKAHAHQVHSATERCRCADNALSRCGEQRTFKDEVPAGTVWVAHVAQVRPEGNHLQAGQHAR